MCIKNPDGFCKNNLHSVTIYRCRFGVGLHSWFGNSEKIVVDASDYTTIGPGTDTDYPVEKDDLEPNEADDTEDEDCNDDAPLFIQA